MVAQYGRTQSNGPAGVNCRTSTSGAGVASTFGIFVSSLFRMPIARWWSTALLMVTVKSTRRYGLAEKFWIVSEKILLLPTIVSTLSGVLIVVPNRPIEPTVPVTPA